MNANESMSETPTEELEDQQPQAEKQEKPRQWLIDRCDGNERVMNPNSKPCCPIFYSPLLLKFFPDYMETNCVMETLGRTGCISPANTRARKIIMSTATIGTIVGWAFLIFSDFAVSLNYYGMIDTAAFNTGSLTLSPCRAGVFDCDSEFDDGVFAADIQLDILWVSGRLPLRVIYRCSLIMSNRKNNNVLWKALTTFVQTEI